MWNQRLILLNRTQIPYRSLTIPCCKKCNNDILNEKVEKVIKAGVTGGYDEFIKIDKKIIFQWLLKLSYGMLFKELSLKMNMKTSDSQSIITPKMLEDFKMLFALLQTVRFNTEFVGNPCSILIFKIEDKLGRNIYDAQDMLMAQCYFMRMGDIGIVAHLQDGGYQEEFFKETMGEFLHIQLHPIQFQEICARFFYKSCLYLKTPHFIMSLPSEKNNCKMMVITQQAVGDVFQQWHQEELAHHLEFFWKSWGFKYQDIYQGNEMVISFLRNEDGSIKKIVE